MQPILFILGILFSAIGLYLLVGKKRMSGLILVVLAAVAIAIAFLTAPAEDITDVAKEELIRIVGSKTIGTHLMPDLIVDFLESEGYDLIEKKENATNVIYRSKHKTKPLLLTVDITAAGSFAGFDALANGNCEIAMASDKIPEELIQKLGRRFDVTKNEHTIAYDAVQLIVSPVIGDKISHISQSHLKDLLVGKLIDWEGLHPDIKGPIRVVVRDSSSGTFHFMKEAIFPNEVLRPDAIRQDYFEKIATAVENDSFAIGFVNFAIDTIHLKQVSILSVVDNKGVAIRPSMASIQSNEYPLSRKLYLYTSTDSDKSAIVNSIIQFCKSHKAAEEVRRDGLVPLAVSTQAAH